MEKNKNYSPESTRGEKLDEMPDYETPNVVVDSEVSVSSPTISNTNPSGQLLKNKLQRRTRIKMNDALPIHTKLKKASNVSAYLGDKE